MDVNWGRHCFFWLSNVNKWRDLPVAKSKYRIYFNDLGKLFNDSNQE
jgi:hypothetical protein